MKCQTKAQVRHIGDRLRGEKTAALALCLQRFFKFVSSIFRLGLEVFESAEPCLLDLLRHDWPLLDALSDSAIARCHEFEGQALSSAMLRHQ